MTTSKYTIGEIIEHTLFGYRGVIVDVDGTFEAQEGPAQRPGSGSLTQPWYHILVDNSNRSTYVSEGNIHRPSKARPIKHPLLTHFFGELRKDRYEVRRKDN